MKTKRTKKKHGGRKAARRNPGMPRIVVATGNPGGKAMAKKKHGKSRHHRKNPHHKGHHRRRRRNPVGGIGKAIMYVAAAVGSGALAFGLPEVLKLSGPAAYAPGGILTGVGVFMAKKNPMLGISIAAGAAAGAGAPFIASKVIVPAPVATSAIIGALGPRLNVPRMAALIQGMGAPVYEPRADMLTRGV